jgi:hypothetical protein
MVGATSSGRVATLRERVHEAKRWRDALWVSILDDLERRNPAAASTVRETLAQRPRLLYCGHSTASAAWAWSALDAQAREDWIWICETIQQHWIRGVVGNRQVFI